MAEGSPAQRLRDQFSDALDKLIELGEAGRVTVEDMTTVARSLKLLYCGPPTESGIAKINRFADRPRRQDDGTSDERTLASIDRKYGKTSFEGRAKSGGPAQRYAEGEDMRPQDEKRRDREEQRRTRP